MNRANVNAHHTAVRLGLALWVTTAVGVAGQAPGTSANPRAQWSEPPETFAVRVIATGLANPWEITWGPDGFLWVTERAGKRIVRVNPADGTSVVALTIDDVHQSLGQDGLLGMALHPRLLRGDAENFVYVAFTYDADPGPELSRRAEVCRYTYNPATGRLGSPMDVLTDLPHGTDHGGGRLIIGPDLKLYLSRGDHGANFLGNYCLANRAQDLPTVVSRQAASAPPEARRFTVQGVP